MDMMALRRMVMAQMAIANGNYELLVDATSSGDQTGWAFTQGDSGQTFDEYKSLVVLFLNAPNSESKTSRVNLSFHNAADAYNDCDIYEFSAGSYGNACFYSAVCFEKFPFGILPIYLYKSANRDNMVSLLVRNTGNIRINITNSSPNTSVDMDDILNSNYTCIALGGYEKTIGSGAKIQIWGRK